MVEPDSWSLCHARVVTLDPDRPRADAVSVVGEQVGAVLDGVPGGKGPRRALDGAVVLPGLTDAHVHLAALGAAARRLDLRGARSLDQAVARVGAAAASTPPGEWLRGGGWDQNAWPGGDYPTRAPLDAVAPANPVWLERVDGHAVWLNGPALARAGIDRGSQEPPGGEIRRDARGEPTGILVDAAITLAAAALPPPGPAEVLADLRAGLGRAAAAGLTAVHDMGTSAAELSALGELAAADELPLRVYVYVALGVELEGVRRAVGLLRVVGRKLYADGALGSHGAALRAPYTDRPATRGLLIHEPAALAAHVRAAARDRLRVAIHAIGDRAVEVALDALGTLAGETDGHRLEHVQVIGANDAQRLAAAGVTASMQPIHATSDAAWVETRLGADRVSYAYAWRTLHRAGVPLAFGSDAPVEAESPWLGLQAAVTRGEESGRPAPGGWSAERLSVEEALAAYTRGPARAVGAAGGVIAVGQPADLTVVDRDPCAIAADQLNAVQVLGTVVAGRWRGTR